MNFRLEVKSINLILKYLKIGFSNVVFSHQIPGSLVALDPIVRNIHWSFIFCLHVTTSYIKKKRKLEQSSEWTFSISAIFTSNIITVNQFQLLFFLFWIINSDFMAANFCCFYNIGMAMYCYSIMCLTVSPLFNTLYIG